MKINRVALDQVSKRLIENRDSRLRHENLERDPAMVIAVSIRVEHVVHTRIDRLTRIYKTIGISIFTEKSYFTV